MTLFTVLMTGVSACGGSAFLYFQLRRSMAAKKARLGFQLGAADYRLIRTWADKNGMSISDYARKVLLGSVPDQEKKRMNGNNGKRSVIDVAFEEVEKQDAFEGNIMPLPPTRQPQPGVVTEAERTHPLQRVAKTTTQSTVPQVPHGPHPCAHLTSNVPIHMKGQCQGACNHSQQPGRICYWPPTSARNCPLFEGRGSGKGVRVAPR